MKTTSIIIYFSILIGCQEINQPNVQKQDNLYINENTPCKNNFDSVLIKYYNKFKATNIDLTKCISRELDSLILKIDTACLEKQLEYKNLVAIILTKLYIHHLQCCNQGYDLLPMKEGSAKIIISSFQKYSKRDNIKLEMLNSGTIVQYIESDSFFKNNKTIQLLRIKIESEFKRIERNY